MTSRANEVQAARVASARVSPGGRTATTHAEAALWRGAPRVISWAILVLLMGAVLSGWVVGSRSVSYATLQHDVRVARTHQVDVDGALPLHSTGSSTVTFRWEVGWRSYVTQVREVAPDPQDSEESDDSVDTIVSGPGVVDRLRASQPGLRIGSTSPMYDPFVLFGVAYPTWAVWALTASWIAVLLWIWIALAPWRATRWAWWWLVLLAPALGLPAYLVLGGPTGLVPPPRQLRAPDRGTTAGRPWVLTGGFAFIFVVLFGEIFRVRS